MTEADLSPHYSLVAKRKYRWSLSDAATLRRAHEAVKYLADLDLDRASEANGRGFSKSDTRLGHALARWPTSVVVAHWAFGQIAINLARKYRRQLPPRLLVEPLIKLDRNASA